MDSEQVREKFKGNPKLKKLIDWLIMNQVDWRPYISIGGNTVSSTVL